MKSIKAVQIIMSQDQVLKITPESTLCKLLHDANAKILSLDRFSGQISLSTRQVFGSTGTRSRGNDAVTKRRTFGPPAMSYSEPTSWILQRVGNQACGLPRTQDPLHPPPAIWGLRECTLRHCNDEFTSVTSQLPLPLI
ncbi:hypothetical protein TNCV_4299911 [Trichonephila clavipes]|nr:hypothetical protein TNCV_4299911 [Trichonephila clavipes]